MDVDNSPSDSGPVMRAKMRISQINVNRAGSDAADPTLNERVAFTCVARNSAYPEDGSDENNTFAKFSPQGELYIVIANPALFGKFVEGQEFYLDFTPANPVLEAAPAVDETSGSD